MARTKQPAIRREPSSEYASRQSRDWISNDSDYKKMAANSSRKTVVPLKILSEKQESGVAQLMVAVSGIYASL